MVSNPLKNDGLRQLGWFFHSQLKAMFQTTNQPLLLGKMVFPCSSHHQPVKHRKTGHNPRLRGLFKDHDTLQRDGRVPGRSGTQKMWGTDFMGHKWDMNGNKCNTYIGIYCIYIMMCVYIYTYNSLKGQMKYIILYDDLTRKWTKWVSLLGLLH